MSDNSLCYGSLDDLFDFDMDNDEKENSVKNAIAKSYQEKFGHAIPFYLLPENASEDEIFNMIKRCVESGKDNILELFNVQIDENVLY